MLFVALLATFALIAAACGGGSSSDSSDTTSSGSGGPSGDPVYFLTAADVTGPLGTFGQRQVDAYKAMIKVVNDNGGVLGRPLEMKHLDGASDPAKAALAIREMLANTPREDILFVVPGVAAPSSAAMMPILTPEEIMSMSMSTTPEVINPSEYPFSFAGYPTNDQQLEAAILGLVDQMGGKQPIGGIGGTDTGSQAQLASAERIAQSQGITYVGSESTAADAADFTPQLQRLRSAGAKGIFVQLLSPSGLVALMRGVQQLGWSDVVLVTGPTGSSALRDIPSEVADQFFALGTRPAIQGTQLNALGQAFKAALLEVGPLVDLGYAVGHADAINYMVWAAETAGSLDSSQLRSTLQIGTGTIPADSLIGFPNRPGYTETVHTFADADMSQFWSLLEPGDPVEGQWKGVPLTLSN